MRSTSWYELILTMGVISWSVWFDRRRFLNRLVAEALWDYVNCPARTKPRTDLERFADGMEWLDLTLMRIMYEKTAS